MSLFEEMKKKPEMVHKFDKHEVIQEVLETKDEICPGWNLFSAYKIDSGEKKIGDFLAIYTDVINKEIKIGSQFSEYKRTVESVYQIVREIYITDEENAHNDSMYKKITAKSAKELFIKLKREQE
jgi:hypothetical protein